MKAFVIKNQLGHYRGPVGEGFYRSILHAVFWSSQEDAERSGYLSETCTVVPIEIKELGEEK